MEDNYNNVLTGDIILVSNNTSTGFLLRTATSSMYNHAGVAIRINDKKEIVLDNSGKLCILEINTEGRYDCLRDEYVKGSAVSDAKWCFKRYNIVMVRKLKPIFRNNELINRTYDFINKYQGWKFTKSFIPFISVWLGVPFDNKKKPCEKNKQLFCTQLVVKYYEECIAPQFDRFTGVKYQGNLFEIFGEGAPNRSDMYTPEHLSSTLTGNSQIFDIKEVMIHKERADGCVVLYQPVIIILVIIALIWFSIHRYRM